MADYNTTSGNHTFNDEVRVDEIKDNAGTGAPNFPNGLQSDGVVVPVVEEEDVTITYVFQSTGAAFGDLTFKMTKIGNLVNMTHLGAVGNTNGAGTSASIGNFAADLPAKYRPSSGSVNIPVALTIAGNENEVLGLLQIFSTGITQFFRDASSPAAGGSRFAASTQASIRQFSFSYTVA